MAHGLQSWTALQQARAAWNGRRVETVQKMQGAASAEQRWSELASSLRAGDVRVDAAKAALEGAMGALEAARRSERLARSAIVDALGSWLDGDPGADVRTMSAAYPIALFPVRLETRFDPPLAPTALHVRIYPDDIQSDAHEPELTVAEGQAGDTFWNTTAAGLNATEAWRRLLLKFAAPRAAYVMHATDPKEARPPTRPSSWTRPAEARLLPDRWIVVAYRGGREVYRAFTKPVVEPLALTVSPLMGVGGDASALGSDPDVGWAADFGRALDAGMAVRIPLTPQDAQVGFDRIVAVGVKASLTPEDTASQVGALWRNHSYSQGVAFVAQGTPTNNTGEAPADYPPDDPNGASSYALHFQGQAPAGGTDGKLFMDALGLPASLAAPIAGAGRLEQASARAMNAVLWPATLGYYLRQWMAPGLDPLPAGAGARPFTDALIGSARTHFLGYVRARGPLPAFRVGSTPYGLLPVTSLRHWTGFGSATARALDLVAVQVRPAAGAAPERDEVRIGGAIHSPANGLYTVFEAGVPVPLMSPPCAFAVAGWDGERQPDLFIIRMASGSSGRTEYTVLSARSGYREISGHGPTSLGFTNAAYAFAIADWDRDGKPDLVVINRQGTSATEVSILSGASGFQHTVIQTATALPRTDANWSFGLADWDKDGIPDLFAIQTAGAASQHIEVHILSGASQFRTEIFSADTGLPSAAGADVSVEDWDGGGVPDVILALRNQLGPFNLTVTVIQGAQQFKAALQFPASLADVDGPDMVQPNGAAAVVMAADWDGDGRAELLAVHNDGSLGSGGIGVTVLSASPVAQFSDAARLADPNRGNRSTVAAAALTADGDRPVGLILLQAAAQSTATDVVYRIARGLDPAGVPARFAPDDALPAGPPYPAKLIGAGVAAADLDGDGQQEIIVYHHDSSSALSRGSYRIGWKLDAGARVDHWSPDVEVPDSSVIRRRIQRLGATMTLADLDASGRPDMIVLLAEIQTLPLRVTVLYYVVGRNLDATGQVSGGWANAVSVPLSLPAGSTINVGGIAVADIDGDGQPDIVVSYVEVAPSGKTAWYRIGWRVDASGDPKGGWSERYRLPGAGDASMAGIALVRVSRAGWTGMLNSLVHRYRQGTPFVPRVGTGTDADADLLRVLTLGSSSHEIGIRRALGPNTWLNLYTYLGTQAFFQPPPADWMSWYQSVQRRARAMLQNLGDPAWNALTNTGAWNLRLAGAIMESETAVFSQPLAAPAPLSETSGLPAINSIPNYLEWLTRLAPVHLAPNEVGLDNATGADNRWPLLFYLARHALLEEYASAAFQIDVAQKGSSAFDEQDPELVGIVPGAPTRTVWDRLRSTMPAAPGSTTQIPVWRYLLDLGPTYSTTLAECRDAMGFLGRMPTAELNRLVSETLDACSHRVDCWVTAMATRRLQTEIRPATPLGLYAGGFGWLEDVAPRAAHEYAGQSVDGQPVLVPQVGGGYIHAPSAAMASAAAVMRNAYMSRGGPASTAYAIDLSSERARVGREVLDSVRDGVPLAAQLGFRVERILVGAGLQRYIDPLRHLYPLVPLQEAAGAPAGLTAAGAVVDGLALRGAWPNLPWGTADLPDVAADRQMLRRLLDAELGAAGAASPSWLDPLDTVADLLTAEAVYQTVLGNKTGAAAALDALSQGTRPPDPEILRQPRHGIGVTHRVAIVLEAPLALADWPAVTPRAAADPYLDSWVGSLLGNPSQVLCRAVFTTGRPPIVTDLGEISLADLGLRALDVLELARSSAVPGGASELDRRLAYAASRLAATPPGASEDQISITYVRDARWAASVRSFPEILELAHSINTMLGLARPLRPVDLLAPESAALAAQALPGAQTAKWAQNAYDTLCSQTTALQAAMAAAPPDAGSIGAALLQLSLFNLPMAVPRISGTEELLQQAAGAVATALDRQDLARPAIARMTKASGWTAVEDARAAVQAIFGRDLPFVDPFTPVEAKPGELAGALGAHASLLSSSNVPGNEVVRRWLTGAARVRPSLDLWRRVSVYRRALGGTEPSWKLAQLPYRPGDAWAGLPFPQQSGPLRAGVVSLVLDYATVPAAGGLWAGLLLDEWTEIIPSSMAPTGVAFHYRSPSAQAPQSVLLAVPPSLDGQWDLEVLLAIINDTLDIAQVRAADRSLAGSLGQVFPAALLAYNPSGDTVSTDFRFVETTE